jgi:hypothetical protein
MLSTLSTNDRLGIMLALVIITILLAPRRCQSWCYTLLACYHRFIALLARTEVFIFCIFLFILAEDVCHAITRTIKPLVLATLDISDKPIAQTSSNSATYAAVPLPDSINTQLRTWMKEDAERVWKDIAESREQEARMIQELRDSYRELATQEPEREILDWSLFEMEERGRIAL